MESAALKKLLLSVEQGKVSAAQALGQIAQAPYENLGFARLDHHRKQRKGFPEVVFAQGKQPQHLSQICKACLKAHPQLLITRLGQANYEDLLERWPKAAQGHYDAIGDTLHFGGVGEGEGHGCIAIVCAGSADLPVAQEALQTSRAMGARAQIFADVGIAGLQRLLDVLPQLRKAKVVVAVAGMEGALPSVVTGLVRVPVIALPTSVGYGTGLGGIAAMAAMLNSCAPGLGVVNIDNGFGAAYLACLINQGT